MLSVDLVTEHASKTWTMASSTSQKNLLTKNILAYTVARMCRLDECCIIWAAFHDSDIPAVNEIHIPLPGIEACCPNGQRVLLPGASSTWSIIRGTCKWALRQASSPPPHPSSVFLPSHSLTVRWCPLPSTLNCVLAPRLGYRPPGIPG